MTNVVSFPEKFLIGQVVGGGEGDDESMEVVIPMGRESLRVYCNTNGDICIKQTNYGECDDDDLIVLPRLYLDSVVAAIGLIAKDSEGVGRL